MKKLIPVILIALFALTSCEKEEAPEALKVSTELNLQGIYDGESLFNDEIRISSATPVTVISEVEHSKNNVKKSGNYTYIYHNYSTDKYNSYKIKIKNDNQTIEYTVTRD